MQGLAAEALNEQQPFDSISRIVAGDGGGKMAGWYYVCLHLNWLGMLLLMMHIGADGKGMWGVHSTVGGHGLQQDWWNTLFYTCPTFELVFFSSVCNACNVLTPSPTHAPPLSSSSSPRYVTSVTS